MRAKGFHWRFPRLQSTTGNLSIPVSVIPLAGSTTTSPGLIWGQAMDFYPNPWANNTAELLEKGGQAEQEVKSRGKGSASLMFNAGCSSSPVSVPVHGLNPRAEVSVTLRVAVTWEWLLQEQQEWHILTATGQKAALMEIEGNLFPSCESWKSGVLPVLGERTIQWGKTPNPLESDLVR